MAAKSAKNYHLPLVQLITYSSEEVSRCNNIDSTSLVNNESLLFLYSGIGGRRLDYYDLQRQLRSAYAKPSPTSNILIIVSPVVRIMYSANEFSCKCNYTASKGAADKRLQGIPAQPGYVVFPFCRTFDWFTE